MAGDVLTGPASASGHAVLENYLLEFEQELCGCGTRRSRVSVLAEVRDGLQEAARRHPSDSHDEPDGDAGVPSVGAARAAVAEFGSAAVVARAFADELAVQHARHVVLLYLVSGPAVGIWWLVLLTGSLWPPAPGGLLTAIPVLPIVTAATALGVGLVGISGRLGRWLPVVPGAAIARTARLVPGACLVGDALMLGLLGARPDVLGPALVGVVAAAASTARIAATIATFVRWPSHRRAVMEGARQAF